MRARIRRRLARTQLWVLFAGHHRALAALVFASVVAGITEASLLAALAQIATCLVDILTERESASDLNYSGDVSVASVTLERSIEFDTARVGRLRRVRSDAF